ncbi:autotransporter-associated beta strand repeat-containing protein [Bradyrhizobium sp. USDA 4011]
MRRTPGTLTLTAAESYSGATTINSGATLALSIGGSISNSTVVTVNPTFDISATSFFLNRITTLAGDGSVAARLERRRISAAGDAPVRSRNDPSAICRSTGSLAPVHLNVAKRVRAREG